MPYPTQARRGARIIASVAVALAGTGVMRAATAHADPEPSRENRSLATALFQEGRRLLDLGQVAEACRKLEESQRLDPGGGTLLNLAACHEREGKTATAWAEFTQALGEARKEGRDDRVVVAQARIAELEPRLPHVTVIVAGTAPADLELILDGTPLGRAAWGMSLPVDPGAHVLDAQARGMRPWSTRFSTGDHGDAQAVSVPPLDPEPEAPPAPAAAPAPSPEPPVVASSPASGAAMPAPSRAPLPVRDIATVGAAVVGVAGLTLGSYFGVHAISLENRVQSGCPGGHCTPAAATTSTSAATNADLSTGFLVGGGVGIGVAALLFFTRPASPPSVTVEPVARGASVVWSGRF